MARTVHCRLHEGTEYSEDRDMNSANRGALDRLRGSCSPRFLEAVTYVLLREAKEGLSSEPLVPVFE
jgi:hypothetical protein